MDFSHTVVISRTCFTVAFFQIIIVKSPMKGWAFLLPISDYFDQQPDHIKPRSCSPLMSVVTNVFAILCYQTHYWFHIEVPNQLHEGH